VDKIYVAQDKGKGQPVVSTVMVNLQVT